MTGKKQRNKEILNISGDPNSCKSNRKEDEKERDRQMKDI